MLSWAPRVSQHPLRARRFQSKLCNNCSFLRVDCSWWALFALLLSSSKVNGFCWQKFGDDNNENNINFTSKSWCSVRKMVFSSWSQTVLEWLCQTVWASLGVFACWIWRMGREVTLLCFFLESPTDLDVSRGCLRPFAWMWRDGGSHLGRFFKLFVDACDGRPPLSTIFAEIPFRLDNVFPLTLNLTSKSGCQGKQMFFRSFLRLS